MALKLFPRSTTVLKITQTLQFLPFPTAPSLRGTVYIFWVKVVVRLLEDVANTVQPLNLPVETDKQKSLHWF